MNELDLPTIRALFPFFFRVDQQLVILEAGESLLKLEPDCIGQSLYTKFHLLRPKNKTLDYDQWEKYQQQIIIFETAKYIKLRGNFVLQKQTCELVFLGTIWVSDVTQLLAARIDLNDFPLHDAMGDMIQLSQFHDIAVRELNEREMELKKSKTKLEQALQSKTEFLSVMSHEIRTPLNSIIGLVQMLLDKDPKPEQLEDLNLLQFSSEHLLLLVNDILDFSKLEEGKLQLELSSFSLTGLLENISQIFSDLCKKKNIAFELF
ncbi:MAG: histidine kinase dimerization/phospho-acceptor domain-containing protein, partial [Spirochaetota bacterium]